MFSLVLSGYICKMGVAVIIPPETLSLSGLRMFWISLSSGSIPMSCKVQYSAALQFSEKWEWEGCGLPGKGEAGGHFSQGLHCSLSSALESLDPSPAAAVPSHRARAQLVTLCSRKLKKKNPSWAQDRLQTGQWRLVGSGPRKLHAFAHTDIQASPQE